MPRLSVLIYVACTASTAGFTRVPAVHVVKPQPQPAFLSAASTASDGGSSGASSTASTLNLIKNVVGAGVLSLPAGVAAGTGLRTALLCTALLGSWSCYTFALLGRMCAVTGSNSFKGLGDATRGPGFARLMDTTCTLKTFFSCLAYSLVIADSFSAIFSSIGLPALVAARSTVLLSMTAVAILPLCLLKDLSVLSITSLLGSAAMLYTTAFMGVRYFDGSYLPGGRYAAMLAPAFSPAFAAAPAPWRVTVKSLVLACSLSTAFIAHYNAPKFYGGLANRSEARFNAVSAVSFSTAIVLFGAVMALGYLTFGTASQGLILNNYATRDPLATVARVAIGSSIVFTYPLAFTGLRDGVSSLLSVPETDRSKLTVALLGAITALALVVRNVGFVNNLGGSIFGAAIIYIFPALLLLSARAKAGASAAEVVFARATIVGGAVLAVLGSVVSVLKEFTNVL